MRYKHFNNANVDVSLLAVGTWAIGGKNYGQVNRTEAIGAIRKMIENGVNLVDTAPVYGNGAAEMIVGEALEQIARDKVLISTKFGLVTSAYTGDARDASYKNVMREVESSLRNLRTDYIDFYFIHWPDGNTPIDETMAALENLKKMGKIRFIGVSNFTEEQILEAEKFGKIDVQQPCYSMVDRRFEELMKRGYERGIDSMTYGSMGAGILSGKIRRIPDFAPDDIRMTFYDYYKEPQFSKIMELLKTMDEIAKDHGKTTAQVAINWIAQKPFVGTALVGVRSKQHAIENCAGMDWELTMEEVKALDSELERLHIG